MFTGIIRHVGVVEAVRRSAGGARLAIDLGPLAKGLAPGDSVAVNGVCLTAAEVRGSRVEFDVVSETLSRTTLGALGPGDPVNLERALAVGGRLDGHLVQGHVDGVATVHAVSTGAQRGLEFDAPPDLAAAMVPKGSVAVDGVSLTLVDVAAGRFSVALVPTTLAETTLARLRVGDRVNVETDLIGKYVLKYLQQATGQAPGAGAQAGLTPQKLKEAGFA